ncbi:hypothetical protein GCM10023086_40470 [Streptomyces venetus]|uniref:Uncharacterized protein n=1 Tax=Streptomyces venetus TaxID=1701086 RepID=A0ABP8G505_9ACTN
MGGAELSRAVFGVWGAEGVGAEHLLAGVRELVVRPAASGPGPGPAGESRCRDGHGEDGPPGDLRLGRVTGAGSDGQERRDGPSGQSGTPPVPRLVHVLVPLRPRDRDAPGVPTPGHMPQTIREADGNHLPGHTG